MNETIKTQLNHRSIRQFKPLALTREEVNLLVDVARHTATSNFRQSYSIISITDETLKEEIAEIANQSYIPNAGHLFVFVVDQRRNTLIAEAKGAEALVQGSPERFISAFSDAMIAAQNVVVAAESYYDLRDLNNRVDEFTTQIAKTMDQSVANRANTLKDLQKQGFFTD